MSEYSVILADPPWKYDDRSSAGKRGADYKYSTMSMRDLRQMRVKALAAEDCALFMWATSPLMPEAIDLMRAWGFKYKNIAFVWMKTNKKSGTPFWGMGNTTRSCCEFVLFGLRGKVPRVSAGVHSVVMDPVGKHSAKPDSVRDRIVELYGDVPRLEIFARSRCEGWDQTGLEIDGKDIFDFIDEKSPLNIRSGLSAMLRRTQVRKEV